MIHSATISKILFNQAIICIITASLLNFSLISLQNYPQLESLWTLLLSTTTFLNLLLYSSLPYLLFTFHKLFFQEYIYIKNLKDIPHSPPQMSQRIKNCGELPPPYPNGWFMLCESNEITRGQVISRHALGKEFAVYRGEDGHVRVMGAFCPHLGANLAICGQVKQNCLVCPFHGWEFNSDGKCIEIPGASTIPKQAEIKSYICVEKNNMILVWHHSEDALPNWEVPTLRQFSENFQSAGYTQHEIACHIQEIPENGPDSAHLNVVHSPFILKVMNFFGFTHFWQAKWSACPPPDSHLAKIEMFEAMRFLSKQIPLTKTRVEVTQCGPGLVYLEFNTTFGRLLLMQNVTPIGPMLQLCRHHAYVENWRIPLFVGRLLLFSLRVQFERDIPIWNNKTYLKTPCVSSGDGPIKQFRRWFSQFYTEKDLQLSKERSILDW